MADAQSSKKSALSDLRHFRRVQKPNDAGGDMKVVRRRIQVASDSDSDCGGAAEANSPKKMKLEMSVTSKEQRFAALMRIAPQYDTVDLQKSLVQTNWDVSEALKYLKMNCPKKNINPPSQTSKPTTTSINGSSHLNKVKRKKYHSDSDDSVKQRKDQVYDSEDSDTEHSAKMTSQRRKVFDFFNSSTVKELQDIKSCSEKKAAAIVEMRPFSSWAELCKKCLKNKIPTTILNNCQDLINKQNNIAKILNKCTTMVKRLEAAISTGAGIVDQPINLNKSFKLAEYQIVGLNWLVVMHNQKMNGILADEMGLGKTIQVIAFLAYLKVNNLSKGAHLIVVPASTLDNWDNELSLWCPSLIVRKYYGSQAERKQMRIQFAKEGFKGIEVLLTTYTVVGSSPEDKKMFKTCPIHYVVFDEAHMLKNMTSQRYANLITINAENRILLTGTPLQNNLLELMSLLCFVMPSFFAKSIEDIKTLFQKKSRTEEQDSSFETSQVEQAKGIMKPFILRRLKKDVLQCLPKKTEIVKKIEMHPEQKALYKSLVEYYMNCTGELSQKEDIPGMRIMMEMRKLGNHPLLMRYYFTDAMLKEIGKRLAITKNYKKTNPEYIFEDLIWMSDFQIWQLCHKYELDDVHIPDHLFLESGKFQEFDVLLPELKSKGHRVLIFSQFAMMLDIVEKYLDIRDHGYIRLDGSTAVDTRQDLIDQFNTDPDIFIFLLTTKAGGVGINLTAADVGIIHDIDYNPYNDKQAADRCHRMGQKKPVTIYRFVSEGTIEEGMLMIAEEKLRLEQEIHSNEKDIHEHKSMVKLLTLALGMDETKAESLMSPQKNPNNKVISQQEPDADDD